MNLQKLYPLLTLVFFLATCVLLYLQYFSAPKIYTIPKTAEIELKVVPQSPENTEGDSNISGEEIQVVSLPNRKIFLGVFVVVF